MLVLGYLGYRVAKVIRVNLDRRAVMLAEEREVEERRKGRRVGMGG